MSITSKLLAVLSAIGAFFSAIFYVLFKQVKDERIYTEKERDEAQAKADALIDAQNQIAKDKKENEEKIQNAHGDDKLDNFNSVIDILSHNR